MSPPKINKPGFYTMTAQEYHADPCEKVSLSSSVATKLVTESPAHVLRSMMERGSFTPTPAMDFGSIVHELLLGKGGGIAVGDFPDWRTNESKAFKAEAIAAGKTPIKRADYMDAQRCVDAARKQLADMGLAYVVTEGESEQVAVWEARGNFMRSMMDKHIPDRELIVDVKTTGKSAHPDQIAKTVAQMNYDLRSEFYLMGVEQLTGKPSHKAGYGFLFIFIETEPPFLVVPCFLDDAFRARGRRRANEAIDLWARCMDRNEWPGYVKGPVQIAAPGWIEYEIDAEEISTGAKIA